MVIKMRRPEEKQGGRIGVGALESRAVSNRM
jgi:hypothetical protein